jgi:hypothetical protein
MQVVGGLIRAPLNDLGGTVAQTVRGGDSVDDPAAIDVHLLDRVHRVDREAGIGIREVGRCGRGQRRVQQQHDRNTDQLDCR